MVTALSGQISLVGILANLAAAPLVGPATVLGFLAAAASLPLPWVARVLGCCQNGLGNLVVPEGEDLARRVRPFRARQVGDALDHVRHCISPESVSC